MEELKKEKEVKKKLKGNIKRKEFFEYYCEHAKYSSLHKDKYNAFIKELLQTLGTAVVKEGIELHMPFLGKLRIKAINSGLLNNKGELRKLRVDWQATKKYWSEIYPGLTPEELKAIPKKTVIYHTNEHSNKEYYTHFWDKVVGGQNLYLFEFQASRQFSRMIATVAKDPNRKIYYYA